MAEQRSIAVVGLYESLSCAIAAGALPETDVVVMGLEPPQMLDTESVQKLRTNYSHVSVVALAENPDFALTRKAVESGCAALIAKHTHPAHLAETARSAAAGYQTFKTGHQGWPDQQFDQSWSSLTGREMEILELLASAKSTAEIAAEFTISQHTVRNHVRSILDKLNAHTRLEAVVKAKTLGYI
ncbi:MAG: response regulator transcription factor [Actinomycetota bacterium]